MVSYHQRMKKRSTVLLLGKHYWDFPLIEHHTMIDCGNKTVRNEVDFISSQPLAFSNIPGLLAATSRLVCPTKDGAFLNIEIFSNDDDNVDKTDTSSPILIFIHGVCSSAESIGVQKIASSAKENNIRVAAIELEGHGLSSGERCVCGDFDRLVGHVVEAVNHIVSSIGCENVPYFLSGNSLGGVLSVYAAQIISNYEEEQEFGRLMGILPIAPAVGVDPDAIPPYLIVQALKLIAFVAPSASLPLTPLEDPTSYNCPKYTKRNYSGHWPLATSKMLLDVTSNRVINDIESGSLSLEKLKCMLVIFGKDDDVVPANDIQTFFDSMKPLHKELVSIEKADHGLMSISKHNKVAAGAMFKFIRESLNK